MKTALCYYVSDAGSGRKECDSEGERKNTFFQRSQVERTYLSCGLTHFCQVIIHLKYSLFQYFLRVLKCAYDCICVGLHLKKVTIISNIP